MVERDYEEHLVPSPVCVAAFASVNGDFGSGLPHFEFGRTLRDLGLAHVLFRDSGVSWYQRGVRGMGDRSAVVHYLRALHGAYRRIVAVGVSSGAYAALMFGKMAALDEVVAISPVTGVGNDVFPDFERRWHFFPREE